MERQKKLFLRKLKGTPAEHYDLAEAETYLLSTNRADRRESNQDYVHYLKTWVIPPNKLKGKKSTSESRFRRRIAKQLINLYTLKQAAEASLQASGAPPPLTAEPPPTTAVVGVVTLQVNRE